MVRKVTTPALTSFATVVPRSDTLKCLNSYRKRAGSGWKLLHPCWFVLCWLLCAQQLLVAGLSASVTPWEVAPLLWNDGVSRWSS
jgi:hypothetical protein